MPPPFPITPVSSCARSFSIPIGITRLPVGDAKIDVRPNPISLNPQGHPAITADTRPAPGAGFLGLSEGYCYGHRSATTSNCSALAIAPQLATDPPTAVAAIAS